MLLYCQRNLGIQSRATHLSQILGLIPVFLKIVLAAYTMALVATRPIIGPLTWDLNKNIWDELYDEHQRSDLKVK